MELHQLRCFVTVAEEGGFNRASKRLRMTQPAISYQIKQLEKHLGARLFYRQPRGIRLTDAGRLLLRHAHDIFEQVRRAEHAIERLSGAVAGELRIGTINSVGMYLLPRVLVDMRRKYPSARTTILYASSYVVMAALLSNQVELAVLANPPADQRLRYETLLEDPVSLVCGRTHPLFEKEEVEVADLATTQFVSLTDANPTGHMVRDYLTRLGLAADPVVSTDNVETVKKMVEIGLGVAMLPDMITHSDVVGGVRSAGRLARLRLDPPLTREIVLVTWRHLELSPPAAAFVSLLRLRCAAAGGGPPQMDASSPEDFAPEDLTPEDGDHSS